MANWVERGHFSLACDYSDSIWEAKDSEGVVTASVSSYYICRQGRADRPESCLTLILSKNWRRASKDPLKGNQSWYCNCCGQQYHPWMGMILEIRKKDKIIYAKVPVKDIDAQHLQILILEANASEQDSRSPEALFKSLKRQTPEEGNHIRKVRQMGRERMILPDGNPASGVIYPYGVYKVDSKWYATLPKWSWSDLHKHGTPFRNAVLP